MFMMKINKKVTKKKNKHQFAYLLKLHNSKVLKEKVQICSRSDTGIFKANAYLNNFGPKHPILITFKF